MLRSAGNSRKRAGLRRVDTGSGISMFGRHLIALSREYVPGDVPSIGARAADDECQETQHDHGCERDTESKTDRSSEEGIEAHGREHELLPLRMTVSAFQRREPGDRRSKEK